MRFKYDSYEKLFPRQPEAPEHIETAVEGFTPTQDLIKETPEAPAAPTPAKAPEQVVIHTTPATTPEPEPIAPGDPGTEEKE